MKNIHLMRTRLLITPVKRDFCKRLPGLPGLIPRVNVSIQAARKSFKPVDSARRRAPSMYHISSIMMNQRNTLTMIR